MTQQATGTKETLTDDLVNSFIQQSVSYFYMQVGFKYVVGDVLEQKHKPLLTVIHFLNHKASMQISAFTEVLFKNQMNLSLSTALFTSTRLYRMQEFLSTTI